MTAQAGGVQLDAHLGRHDVDATDDVADQRLDQTTFTTAQQRGQFSRLVDQRQNVLFVRGRRRCVQQKAGQPRAARPCIYCYTCVSTAYLRQPVRCAVNPDTGFECERSEAAKSLSAPRHVVVIGGGPGGMEAACRLDEAGVKVTLVEAGARLGGTLRFAALAYPPNGDLLDYLIAQIGQSTVDVHCNTPATPDLLRRLAPDAVVVATGARRTMPELPGADLPHVYSGDDLRALMLGDVAGEGARKAGLGTRLAARLGAASGMSANAALIRTATKAWLPLGKRIVILGGELVGVELAEFLAGRGREVTVIEPAPRLGKGLLLVRRMRLLSELKEHGVALQGGVSELAIEPGAVRYKSQDGTVVRVPADHVIVAMGATGDMSLADTLIAQGHRVEVIGDATGVSYIEGVIRGGAEAARRLLGNPPVERAA
ncbi:MAG: hypothetical protein DI591_03995 [Citromicrobium sp.]|nr:MAG: hypothetical protein DI591_03995 [Citromicrobium sp.]